MKAGCSNSKGMNGLILWSARGASMEVENLRQA